MWKGGLVRARLFVDFRLPFHSGYQSAEPINNVIKA